MRTRVHANADEPWAQVSTVASQPAPVLMHPSEIVSVKAAAAQIGRSEKTVRRLCARYGLARQTSRSAPLEISRIGLEMALHGDLAAIELLRAGRRSDPAVRRYLDHLSGSNAQQDEPSEACTYPLCRVTT